MPRLLLAALVSGAISIGLSASANATIRPVTTVASFAPTATALTVASHCSRNSHWVPRYRRRGRWQGGYCRSR